MQVHYNLAKVEVASSNLVSRSKKQALTRFRSLSCENYVKKRINVSIQRAPCGPFCFGMFCLYFALCCASLRCYKIGKPQR